MVKLILNAGGNPNIQDNNGNVALCHAQSICNAQNIEITKALLEDPRTKADLPNDQGLTALSIAAGNGKKEHVAALLEREDVNPDSRDIHGKSPLSWVFGTNGVQHDHWAKAGRKAVLKQLLRIPSVDPNNEDQNGLTPLLLAIMSYQGHEYVEILLSRPDLDVNRPRAGSRDTPLDIAKKLGNMATVALLRTRHAEESVIAVEPHSFAASFIVEDGRLPSRYTVFAEMPPHRRQRMRARRSSSQGSGTSSDESDFEYSCSMTLGLEHTIHKYVLREFTLYLGEQAYAEEWAPSTASMCSSCLDINLGPAFWGRHTQYGGRVIADMGRVDATGKKRNCPLCCFFATLYPRTSLKEGHKLVSFSAMQSWLCHEALKRWNDFRFKRFADTMLLAVVAADSVVSEEIEEADENQLRCAKDLVQNVFSLGLIGRLGSNGPDQASVTIPRLATEVSDWSLARGWITLCRENHSGQCNPRKTALVPHLYLIECSTRQIIEQKECGSGGPPPYVALSYVWGLSQGAQQPPQRHKQQESLDGIGDGIVEPVIEDAIRVTLELGYRYLWVDRYCIVQTGDEDIKQEQLRHMHLVYTNAELTLIAAAGMDSSAGLPGAPGRPRSQQPSAIIQGHVLVHIPPDPSLHIRSNSVWATRGWTYQEGLLARRRLYFSEYEMSYECRHMLCREAIRLPRGFERHMSGHKPRFMEPFWMYQPYKLPGMDASQTGVGFFDLLEVYTQRKLSLPSDTLNAMLGIFSLYAQHKKRPIYHICGVPILRLPEHHDPTPWLNPRKPTESSDTGSASSVGLGGFLDGLCWRLKELAHRRPGFPSWSWTGWQGEVAGMNKGSTAIRQTKGFAIDVSIVPGNQDGGVAVPWSHCYDQLRMVNDNYPDIRSGQNHVLEITASTVAIRFRRGDYDGRPNTWIGTVCAGYGVWQGEFFLTSKDVLVTSLLQDSWTGIVLGNSESQKYKSLHDTAVLVIQEQKDKHGREQGNLKDYKYCERVGLLSLKYCTLESSMLEQRTWRVR